MKIVITESQYNILKENKLRNVIINISSEYSKKYGCSVWDINNGYCGDFADDVIQEFGGESDSLYILSDDMFFNFREPEFAIENWDGIIETPFGVWSKKMLDLYGYPPVDINKIDDEISHNWIYYNGKHYDAETPNGVDNWFELPIMINFFNQYN